MRILVGFVFIVFSIIGSAFFGNYKGSLIQTPFLWYAFFILIGITGALLIITSLKKTDRLIDDKITNEINRFKLNGQKVELNFDQCEFKNGSYHHEVKDENINTLNYLVPASAASFHNPTRIERVVQSYLVYTHQVQDKNEKYVSPSFPVDETTLKYYVLSNKIVLYINPFNSKEYYFDLQP